jgi:SSS family solute:Na+ symporter
VLPPWLGGLALAALFAAEISTADAVLFMLSTSLSRDLFQALLRPQATDAELLRVGRLAAVAGGALSVGLTLLLPSVAAALKLFYGVMTAALFVPLVVGLLSRRPGARHARAAIAASILSTVGLLLALSGRPSAEWLPSLVGILLAALVFATAWVGHRR